LDSSGGKLDRFIVQWVMCSRVHSSGGYLDFFHFCIERHGPWVGPTSSVGYA
jgi:hypothetical protein